MVQPHRPMVRFTANAVRGNPALSPSPASSARSIEQQPKVLSMPVSASPSVPNSIGRHSSYHLGDGSNNGGGPAPLSRSTSDSILDAGIHAVSSGGGGSSSSSRGLSTPSLRRTLMYLSRSSSAPLDEVSTPRHARVHGRKPFAHYGLDQRRRFGPVAFSRSASDSARRLPQPPPPPPRGNIISMGSIPALARSLSGHTDHAGHASPLPLPLSLDTPPLERGLSYMSFVTIASEGSPTNHALDSPPQPQPRFQSPVRPWIKKSRSGSTSVSRESPLTLQSYPSLQSLPSFSNIPIGLNNKPTYDSLRSVGSSGYSAEQEETDDVMYGSMRTIIQGRPQGQAQPPARRWPQPQSVLDQDHIGANAELTVVTSPPPRPSTPLPRSLSATSGGAAENCELPVRASTSHLHLPFISNGTQWPLAAIPRRITPLYCLRSSGCQSIGTQRKAIIAGGFVGWTTTPHSTPLPATRWLRESRSRSKSGKVIPFTTQLLCFRLAYRLHRELIYYQPNVCQIRRVRQV